MKALPLAVGKIQFRLFEGFIFFITYFFFQRKITVKHVEFTKGRRYIIICELLMEKKKKKSFVNNVTASLDILEIQYFLE